ncbi:MAG: hypothetical protein F4X64_03185 [Chloroflexi bacterium]|nr:hypothetical protein [Chloroflexota bacterium]
MRGAASEQTQWTNVREAVLFWRAPAIAGSVTALGAWAVWYFTKVPCIMENALAGLCNPSVLASYINLPALASCLAIGGGFATATGGYNFIMLNRERQRADDAEARLQAERERNDQRQARMEERYERLLDELEDERRQANEERRQANEDRRQATAAQQAMMNTLVEIGAAITRLAEQQQNGHTPNHD